MAGETSPRNNSEVAHDLPSERDRVHNGYDIRTMDPSTATDNNWNVHIDTMEAGMRQTYEDQFDNAMHELEVLEKDYISRGEDALWIRNTAIVGSAIRVLQQLDE